MEMREMEVELRKIRTELTALVVAAMNNSKWKMARKLVSARKSIDVVLASSEEKIKVGSLASGNGDVMRNFIWCPKTSKIRVVAPDGKSFCKYDHPIEMDDWNLVIAKMDKMFFEQSEIKTKDLRAYLYNEKGVRRECKHKTKTGQCFHAPEFTCDLLALTGFLLDSGKPRKDSNRSGKWTKVFNGKTLHENADSVLQRLKAGEVIVRFKEKLAEVPCWHSIMVDEEYAAGSEMEEKFNEEINEID